MRCIIVNNANLKAEVCCAHCGRRIDESYVREICSQLIYCDYRCYSVAFKSSVSAIGYLVPTPSAWSRSS
jgi:hypothetical protein